ncbi:MAG: ectoine/hydroxyectoine ABC transporter permease subunit EhuD [Anaerolineae bacterium]
MGLFDWQFALEILPRMLEGLLVTIEATFVGFIIAVILGLLLALGRRSQNPWISQPLGGLVEFIRSTPLLVQLFFFFFVLPRYGLRLPAFVVGTVALGLHYGTYTSEVYRAGIDAIERGQWEAATALNFSPLRVWTGIILPQAIPPMFPALGNYLIGMFKESAQLLAITVTELMLTARVIGTETFRFLEPITMAGLLYFLLSYPSALIVQRLEARYARKS